MWQGREYLSDDVVIFQCNLIDSFYIYSLFMCVCLHDVPHGGFRSPGTGVTEGRELPCGRWEQNSGPLQEQQVLLTTKPALRFPSFGSDHKGCPFWDWAKKISGF